MGFEYLLFRSGSHVAKLKCILRRHTVKNVRLSIVIRLSLKVKFLYITVPSVKLKDMGEALVVFHSVFFYGGS